MSRLLASKKTGRNVKKLSSPCFCSESKRMLLKALWQCFSIGIYTLSIGVAAYFKNSPRILVRNQCQYLTKRPLIQNLSALLSHFVNAADWAVGEKTPRIILCKKPLFLQHKYLPLWTFSVRKNAFGCTMQFVVLDISDDLHATVTHSTGALWMTVKSSPGLAMQGYSHHPDFGSSCGAAQSKNGKSPLSLL